MGAMLTVLALATVLSATPSAAMAPTRAAAPAAGRGALAPARRAARAAARAPACMKLSTNLLEYGFGLQEPELAVPGSPSPDAPPEPFHGIGAAQRETLIRDGVVHIPGLLSAEWLEYLRQATSWQIEHPHMWASPGVASGLYDYIQRNVWSTNSAYANFYYHSPLASALAQLSGTDEIRLSTDLLMVNPNKGFKWHQDNQNGPVAHEHGLRFWVTLDDTPPDHGAPVYLKGSHENESVEDDVVFVDRTQGDLPRYPELLEFRPKAGDLIVWHPRSIHKIDGPASQDWGKRLRRVLGGTVIVGDAPYRGEGRALFSDLGSHSFKDGDKLQGPYFPCIYPASVDEERLARARGECTRTTEGVLRLMRNMWASAAQMASFGNVVNVERAQEEERAPAPPADADAEGGAAAGSVLGGGAQRRRSSAVLMRDDAERGGGN